jgi:hypothetical protein
MDPSIDPEHYLEKTLIINNRTLRYKGIFRSDELFSTINRVLDERGYQKREKKSEETVAESGKKIYLELRPFKVMSKYVRLMIKLKITLDNVTEKAETVRGEKRLYQVGEVNISFDSWSLTDYANRWGMKPFIFFMKGMIHKFVKKFPLEGNFAGEVVKDTAHLYAAIKALLNSYKIETGKLSTEEEIRKQVEMQMMSEVEDNNKEN